MSLVSKQNKTLRYLLKLFKFENYVKTINKVIKIVRIFYLLTIKFRSTNIIPVWNVSFESKNDIFNKHTLDHYNIFNCSIDLENINWHKDISSGFTYPLTRIDKLKLSKYYDKDIDILYVWVQSRFHFGVNLAQLFLLTNNINYYLQFKKLVLDWIEKNPFLHGANWLSPMEAAIRSINWIVAINLFDKIFKDDKEFNHTLSISLQQHARYISRFPEIYKNGHTTNHTTADYAGLLFLALSLKGHPDSDKWLEQSITGLINCIDYQVYEDGTDFEGSVPYHRLVLELFAYSAIVCKSNNVSLPDSYYSKLFKMFEYTAAYINKKGNAPSVGDDDSGRILVFNNLDEYNFYNQNCNQSYLLKLGEYIFNYQFLSTSEKISNETGNYLPGIKKIGLNDINIQTRAAKKSIRFDKSGTYFLKNRKLDFMLACIPIGQNGQGGHNHFDNGSFTLSIDGEQVIVDPGTAVYSSNKNIRDKFRSYQYHNTLYNSFDETLDFKEIGIWESKPIYKCNIDEFNCDSIGISIESKNDPFIRKRKFEIDDNQLIITDDYNGTFFSRLNFHPDIRILSTDKTGLLTNRCEIYIDGAQSFYLEEYEYSLYYQKVVKSKYLNIPAKNGLKIIVKAL